MEKLEQVKRLAMTYYALYLRSGLDHYKVLAYKTGDKYKVMKYRYDMDSTLILKLVA